MLTFMFMCNMIGALTILPAIAAFIVKPKEGASDKDWGEDLSIAELMKGH